MSACNNDLYQSYQLIGIATRQAESGNFQAATQTIGQISNSTAKQLAVGELVKQYVRFDQLNTALRLATNCEISRKIVQALAAKGDTTQAIKLTEQKITDCKELSSAYLAISEAFIQSRNPSEAEKYALKVTDEPKRANLLHNVRLIQLTMSN